MFLLFLLIWKDISLFPTYPKNWDQNQVVHSRNLFGGLD